MLQAIRPGFRECFVKLGRIHRPAEQEEEYDAGERVGLLLSGSADHQFCRNRLIARKRGVGFRADQVRNAVDRVVKACEICGQAPQQCGIVAVRGIGHVFGKISHVGKCIDPAADRRFVALLQDLRGLRAVSPALRQRTCGMVPILIRQ